MKESLSGKWRQLTPITVRARLSQLPVSGEKIVLYDVIDGFHRSGAALLLKWSTIEAKVVYGCTDEELYDLRVLAASSVKSVSYTRTAQWMLNSYSHTKWSERGIGLMQIISLAMADSSGKNIGMGEFDVAEAKEWIERKRKMWGLSLATIFNRVRMAQLAHPSLLQLVKIGGGGGDHRNEISPARLEAIVLNLPDDQPMQVRVARAVMSANLVAREAEQLAIAVALAPTPETKLEAIEDALKLKSRGNQAPLLISRPVQDASRKNELLVQTVKKFVKLAIALGLDIDSMIKMIEAEIIKKQ